MTVDMAGERQHVWCNAQGDVLCTWESLSVLFPSSGNCLLFEWNPQCGQYLITCLKLNLKMESIHKSQSMLQVFWLCGFFPLQTVFCNIFLSFFHLSVQSATRTLWMQPKVLKYKIFKSLSRTILSVYHFKRSKSVHSLFAFLACFPFEGKKF